MIHVDLGYRHRMPADGARNLRWNPFGEATLEDRKCLALLRVSPPPAQTHLQIMGDAGHGKTSSLLALLGVIEGARYVYVPDPTRPESPPLGRLRTWLGAMAATTPLLIDEAQRWPALALWLLSWRRGTTVLATHDDLRDRWHRRLETVQLVFVDDESLEQIIEGRLRWARRTPTAPVPRLAVGALRALRARHGACIRAIEDELYRLYQRHDGGGDVEV